MIVAASSGATVERVSVSAFKIPTDEPESDGTLEWDSTTLVVVQLESEGVNGIGYTYADAATGKLIEEKLAPLVRNADPMQTERVWSTMVASIRNLGRPGIASMAISAVDNALWDLKARLLDMPLYRLLGAVRDRVPVYGSGGFTSYTIEQLQRQLAAWVDAGIPRVKMKIGRHPLDDIERVAAARAAVGDETELFVDANGAYRAKEALAFAGRFVESGVTWYEEPVYHRDLAGLRFVRDHAPVEMEVSAGEYGYDPIDFSHLIEGCCVDVLQADVTRCEGITGFSIVDSMCVAKNLPLSTHCAPALSAHPAAAAKRLRHIEYFHDHVRIEQMLFDGFPPLVDGAFDLTHSGPGNGLTFKRHDAERFSL